MHAIVRNETNKLYNVFKVYGSLSSLQNSSFVTQHPGSFYNQTVNLWSETKLWVENNPKITNIVHTVLVKFMLLHFLKLSCITLSMHHLGKHQVQPANLQSYCCRQQEKNILRWIDIKHEKTSFMNKIKSKNDNPGDAGSHRKSSRLRATSSHKFVAAGGRQ
jgi:hypothetical protein